MNNNKIIIKTDTGEELTYDIVAMLTSKVGKSYVFFKGNEVDSDGKPIVYGSHFVIEDNKVKLLNEVTDEEFEGIKDIYNSIVHLDDEISSSVSIQLSDNVDQNNDTNMV